MFANGGEVSANAGEHLSAGEGAESAGDFLLDLDHADVAFGLVVSEGDMGVLEESQNGELVLLKAEQKVEGFGTFLTPRALYGWRNGFWVFAEPGF